MFQSFEVSSHPEFGGMRLGQLRGRMVARGLDGFLVPRADLFQGEYVAPCDARLQWLTGFTGSAGFCIALTKRAGLFIDGRYRTQVKDQVDLAHFTPVPWPEVKPADWLRDALPTGGKIGFDPWLHTAREVADIEAGLAGSSIQLVPSVNLIDQIWQDRPAPPTGQVFIQPIEFAGESADAKRGRIGAALAAAGQKAVVLTLPDSLSWLLNVRGSDIERNPVVQCLGIAHDDASLDLFIDPAKLAPEVLTHFGDAVRIHAFGAFEAALSHVSGPVRVDRATAPLAVSQALQKAGIAVDWGADPCILPKACKNAAEIAGMTEAHLRDGAAMVEFLAWLSAEGNTGNLTEIAAVKALEGFRQATNRLKEISFETICGSGPHGAIIHYRVTKQTDRRMQPGEIVVIDSGGQYVDGTTDITRTVAIGTPGPEERDCFTRVLQGMIAVSRLRWPKGLAGSHLDAIARYPLWLAHQDYNHGTGHGVGAYLSVHEGPAGISRRSDQPLEPGMILSNEPGYYREGAFGIRIENLVLVEPAPPLPGGDSDREMLRFATLTQAPIDRSLIATGLLTRAEVAWLNNYHAGVLERIGPRVSEKARAWLQGACAPL